MSSLFDFSKVEAAKNSQYVRPGMWRMTPTAVELEQPDNKNPRLRITFTHKSGASFKEMFIITPKALSRLQYLHEACFDKKLEKAFSSVEQLGEYFKKALLTKPRELPLIVGGEESSDGKIYARLPFTGFIVANEENFEEGEFEQGTARYNDVVRKQFGATSIPSDSAVLPSTDELPSSEDGEDSDSDMPW